MPTVHRSSAEKSPGTLCKSAPAGRFPPGPGLSQWHGRPEHQHGSGENLPVLSLRLGVGDSIFPVILSLSVAALPAGCVHYRGATRCTDTSAPSRDLLRGDAPEPGEYSPRGNGIPVEPGKTVGEPKAKHCALRQGL